MPRKIISRPFLPCSDHGDPYNMFGTDDRLRAKKIAEERILEALTNKDIQDLDKKFLKVFGKKKRTTKSVAMADEDINDFLK